MDFYQHIRPVLFRLDPEIAHRAALFGLEITRHLGVRPGLVEKPTSVMGLRFPNPVGLAAGFDKNGRYIEALSQLGFGFIEIGTVTPLPQRGNPRPRLFRIPEAEALINRMGFNNAGAETVFANIARAKCNAVVGVSIGKNATTPIDNALNDYLTCYRRAYKFAGYVAVNISSPGTKHLRRLQEPEHLTRLLRELKAEQNKLAEKHDRYVPLVVKVALDFDSLELRTISEILVDHRVDGIIATNTTLSREEVKGLPRADEAGGLSGVPLRERALDVLREINEYVEGRIPLIASGGIMNAEDAQARMDAGASLVQVYTGLVYKGPALIKELLHGVQVRTTPENHRLTSSSSRLPKVSRFLLSQKCAPLLPAADEGVSAPRKAWRIWSGESPGMERVNHPRLPSVAPLAERCFGHRRLEHA